MSIFSDLSGATAIEYAVVSGLVAVFMIAALKHLDFEKSMTAVTTGMTAAGKSNSAYEDANNDCETQNSCEWN